MTENFLLAADLFNLDEVVVTGVAEATPRKKLAFTVAQINKDLVELAPARDALHGLLSILPTSRYACVARACAFTVIAEPNWKVFPVRS